MMSSLAPMTTLQLVRNADGALLHTVRRQADGNTWSDARPRRGARTQFRTGNRSTLGRQRGFDELSLSLVPFVRCYANYEHTSVRQGVWNCSRRVAGSVARHFYPVVKTDQQSAERNCCSSSMDGSAQGNLWSSGSNRRRIARSDHTGRALERQIGGRLQLQP